MKGKIIEFLQSLAALLVFIIVGFAVVAILTTPAC